MGQIFFDMIAPSRPAQNVIWVWFLWEKIFSAPESFKISGGIFRFFRNLTTSGQKMFDLEIFFFSSGVKLKIIVRFVSWFCLKTRFLGVRGLKTRVLIEIFELKKKWWVTEALGTCLVLSERQLKSVVRFISSFL